MPADPDALLRTWDGQAVAPDRPMGCTVVVRRPAGAGRREVLMLHRAHHGPDHEGDWAWTSPAGCRLPGEAGYPAALRELAEEAGLESVAPWAVDLSGEWALFALDVPKDCVVDLVDPEHDRFEWLSPEEAAARVLPAYVAEQQLRAARVPVATLSFRALAEADFAAVARWHRQPHVREFWDRRSLDEESVRRRYGPRLRGDESVRMWVVEIDGAAVGMLQSYRVGDHPAYAAATGEPEAVAFDYLIGDRAWVGGGIGTRVVWDFCRDVLLPEHPGVQRLVASPSMHNGRSQRVLEKCGFVPGGVVAGADEPDQPADPEIVCTLDVAHWFGT